MLRVKEGGGGGSLFVRMKKPAKLFSVVDNSVMYLLNNIGTI